MDNHVLFSFGTWLSKGKNTWGTTPFEIVPIIVHLSITAFLAISRDHRLSDGLTLLARATTSQERVGSHETGRAIEKLSFKRASRERRLHFSLCLARRGTSKKEAQDARRKRSSTLQPEVLPKLKIVETKIKSSIKHQWRNTVYFVEKIAWRQQEGQELFKKQGPEGTRPNTRPSQMKLDSLAEDEETETKMEI